MEFFRYLESGKSFLIYRVEGFHLDALLRAGAFLFSAVVVGVVMYVSILIAFGFFGRDETATFTASDHFSSILNHGKGAGCGHLG